MGTNFVHEEDDCSWEDLQRIEKIRRNIMLQGIKPFCGVLFQWKGTVLKSFFSDPFAYFLMIFYLVIRIIFYVDGLSFNEDDTNPSLGVGNIGIIGGFLTFFLIFYGNRANNRFDDLFKASMSCRDCITDIAALSCTCLPRAEGLRLLRYLNAAHVAGYVGVSGTYTYDNFFTKINKAQRLLTTSELKRMESICMDTGASSCYCELISWSLALVEKACVNGHFESRNQFYFTPNILKLRGSIGTIYNMNNQPIKFFYVHFVSLLSVLYLPLFTLEVALSTGTTKHYELHEIFLYEFVAIITVFFQAIFVIGLRTMADRLADPYGSDYEDLSVLTYVIKTWATSRKLLDAQLPHETDLYVEEQMCEEATQLLNNRTYKRRDDKEDNMMDPKRKNLPEKVDMTGNIVSKYDDELQDPMEDL